MTVDHSFFDGGTFGFGIGDFLPIFYKASFTKVSGPGPAALPDVLGSIVFDNVGGNLFGGGFWSHTPGPFDQHNPLLDSGGFHAGIFPEGLQKDTMSHVTPDEAHYTGPSNPAPGALPLFALAGLMGTRRRRK